ncbi:RluA family pseudouridine synthase [Pelotomaculum propionicicum]|uniref:Pseudouridine synthase n=1 Tax=Pelotomaculum propionicicum TaxID=258475 RepID=A0A4Y7RVH3_9FIRM|nr:RluA family pseudouridine synthase [Pelotomaculum propionicicum]NLI12060.1 RluA family pseudouridine synthase [Peptococcaceae bacterium]TEB13018.1 Ribosomal large subunit pseudouridine synthase D [Pelotomaculum propionicicum]
MKLNHQVAAEEAGRTAEKIIRDRMGLSRSMIRKLKRLSGVLVNGESVYLNKRLREGDSLSVDLRLPVCTDAPPQPIPLNIVFEDGHLLVIDKPENLLVHPLKHEPENTLANAVLYHYLQHDTEPVFRPVTRLDRNTTGLVVVAKNAHAGFRLARQLAAGDLWREYYAVVHGLLKPENGSIDLPIGRVGGSNVKHTVCPGGRPALTYYQVDKYLAGATLVKLRLATGRTHQIRVHLSHIGHPLAGDTLYGGRLEGIARQALHCARIGFRHPITGEVLDFAAPLPEDMRRLLKI